MSPPQGSWYEIDMLEQDIGRAIQAAMARVGMSTEQLGRVAALDVALVVSILGGERLASTAKLDRIADALGLDAVALYAGRDVERSLVVLPRHAARTDFRAEDLPVLRLALERGAALAEVSGLLGKENLSRQFEPGPPGADPAQDGYHRARLVRRALENLSGPLDDLPVLLAERFGVPVIETPLATRSMQAAAVRSTATRAGAAILNPAVEGGPRPGSSQAWLVNRVSVCHELCHLLFDEPRGGAIDVVLDDDPRMGHDKAPIEQRAGAFAAEMLIPLFGLRELFGQEGGQTDTPAKADAMVNEVRAHFRTPAEIAVNHLYNHGYVARIQAFREELIGRAQAREASMPVVQPTTEPDAWRRISIARTKEAHDAGLITDGAARVLLELPPGESLPWELVSP